MNENGQFESTPPPGVTTDPDCPFCAEAAQDEAVEICGSVLAIEDADPVSAGHLLVITRRHTVDFFSMTAREKRDAVKLLTILRGRALAADPTITGFNVGVNCGRSAGQQIMHVHIHFIPRRNGGESRQLIPKGVVRNKMTH